MKKKGQAAMEFLMTYGWAIVVVLAAIGALAYFGVLSPNKLLPDRTTFTTPLPNVDNAVINLATGGATATIEVAFKNNKGVAIKNITEVAFIAAQSADCSAIVLSHVYDKDGADLISTPTTTIGNGDGFRLMWTCTTIGGPEVGDKFKSEFVFNYVNSETNQVIKHTGTVEGKYS